MRLALRRKGDKQDVEDNFTGSLFKIKLSFPKLLFPPFLLSPREPFLSCWDAVMASSKSTKTPVGHEHYSRSPFQCHPNLCPLHDSWSFLHMTFSLLWGLCIRKVSHYIFLQSWSVPSTDVPLNWCLPTGPTSLTLRNPYPFLPCTLVWHYSKPSCSLSPLRPWFDCDL